MTILKFISWWWAQLAASDKATILVGLICLSIFPGVYFFGLHYFLYLILAMVVRVVLLLATVFVKYVKSKWEQYNGELDRNADQVVNRLSGKG
jgi:hypothetical protein